MKYIIIAGILILIGFLIALSFIPLGKEPLTEVFFENHTLLRDNIFPGQQYNFTFTVHNLEYREMNYGYNVTAYYVNQSVQIKSGELDLNDNESASMYVNYSLPKGFSRAKVEVLVWRNETDSIDIHFWNDEIVGTTVTTVPA